MFSRPLNSPGENLKPELTEQETLIQDILESLVGKVYGANATPETILKGYSAYVHQELVEGTAEPGLPLDLLGCTKYSIEEITFASDINISSLYNINHSLGVKPKYAILLSDFPKNDKICLTRMVWMYIGTESYYSTAAYEIMNTSGMKYNTTPSSNLRNTDATVNTIPMYASGSTTLKAGVKYTLITLA